MIVDFNHSGIGTDYVNYGYNEPIISVTRIKYGVWYSKAEGEPLKIMVNKGGIFLSFLEKAADCSTLW